MKSLIFLAASIVFLYFGWSFVIKSDPSGSNQSVVNIQDNKKKDKNSEGNKMKNKIEKTDEEWKKILSDEEYRVLRQKGTERAFTGKYNDHKEEGMYVCAACENELFDSETKYNSGSGWPSYWAPVATENVILEEDNNYGMRRTEVMCARCGGHLGHVFTDGPKPTGMRYCINSVSLKFKKDK